MSFWDKAEKLIKPKEEKEEVVNLQEKLSKLDLEDISYIYDMMINGNYRGRELEKATTTYLKVKFIKAALESEVKGEKETKNN